MKKKKLYKIVIQQAETIREKDKQIKELYDWIANARSQVVKTITGMIGERDD